MLIVGNHHLFADAEFHKDIPQYLIAVISPPTISARWKRHSRKSWLMKSPGKMSLESVLYAVDIFESQ